MYVQLLVFVLLVVRLVPVAVVIVAKAALEADLGGIEGGGDCFCLGLDLMWI